MFDFLFYTDAQKKFNDACKNGNVNMVKKFLNDKNFDPSYHKNSPLFIAIKNRRYAVINLLIKDNRVSVIDRNHKALEILCDDPKFNDSKSIKEIVNSNIVSLPITVDPGIFLVKACDSGNLEVVKELLSKANIRRGVSPNYYSNMPLMQAAMNGHVDIVNELLKHKGVDPSDKTVVRNDSFDAVDISFTYDYKNTAKTILSLLNHNKVNLTEKKYIASLLSIAIKNGYVDVLSAMIKKMKQEKQNIRIDLTNKGNLDHLYKTAGKDFKNMVCFVYDYLKYSNLDKEHKKHILKKISAKKSVYVKKYIDGKCVGRKKVSIIENIAVYERAKFMMTLASLINKIASHGLPKTSMKKDSDKNIFDKSLINNLYKIFYKNENKVKEVSFTKPPLRGAHELMFDILSFVYGEKNVNKSKLPLNFAKNGKNLNDLQKVIKIAKRKYQSDIIESKNSNDKSIVKKVKRRNKL